MPFPRSTHAKAEPLYRINCKRRCVERATSRKISMATLPPDPYAPDPIREPDGTPMPNHQPESLPGPDNPEPPVIEPDDPSDKPTQTQA